MKVQETHHEVSCHIEEKHEEHFRQIKQQVQRPQAKMSLVVCEKYQRGKMG